MSEYMTVQQIDQAAQVVSDRAPVKPKIGIILGSGLASLSDSVDKPSVIPFSDIPNWPTPTVEGHHGRLVLGTLESQPVLVMQGRVHYYEGYSMAQIGFPVRVMKRLGIDILIVTNAAGGVNPNYEPGEVMLITDHLNLIGMAGLNPLRGPNLDEFGPRFPDMSCAYDRSLAELARKVAAELDLNLHEGVYICLAGPSFETPADLRFLRTIGADTVGMSTVPEVTVARHSNMKVLGLSTISNKANLDGNTVTTHEEVLAAGKIVMPRLSTLIRGVLRHLDGNN